MAQCRTCGAGIIWMRAAKTGSLMPIDVDPVSDGNIAIKDGVAHVASGDLFQPAIPEGPRYKSHFATCPQAKEHRRSTAKKAKE